jgi:hypothetical protein
MVTLTNTIDRVADMLARSDLNSQIEAEIKLAIARYNRRVSWLSEVRAGTLATVANQSFYSTFDITAADAVQDVAGRSAVSFQDVLKIDHLRDADYDELRRVSYSDFERFFDTSGSSGGPDYFTIYGGKLGLWPVPDAIETLTISAVVKPQVPSIGGDTSVWFEQAQELIENAAAQAVCIKFTQDAERAAIFAALEKVHYDDLVREGALKMATGRLRAHD